MTALEQTGLPSQEREWRLQDEILAATHRWRLIVACCLAGSLLGWLFSWALPSPYQASKELFVGLNISPSARARGAPQTGLPVANANDYKNWQMASLNTFIFTDAIIDETLTQLQSLDPYWNSVDQEALAGMLRVYWRNAGKWRLVAENPSPLRAGDAVIVWEGVVVEHVHDAVAQSQQAMQIDLQLQAATAELAALEARQAGASQVQAQQQAVDALAEEYRQAAAASQGLAPELVVQKLSDRKLRQSVVRPTGQAMLIGAALGWIAWLFIWLGRPIRKAGV